MMELFRRDSLVIVHVSCEVLYHETHLSESILLNKTAQAHSSVELAGVMGGLRIRILDTDDQGALRGETLEEAIKNDIDNQLIPFFVIRKSIFDSEQLSPINFYHRL